MKFSIDDFFKLRRYIHVYDKIDSKAVSYKGSFFLKIGQYYNASIQEEPITVYAEDIEEEIHVEELNNEGLIDNPLFL